MSSWLESAVLQAALIYYPHPADILPLLTCRCMFMCPAVHTELMKWLQLSQRCDRLCESGQRPQWSPIWGTLLWNHNRSRIQRTWNKFERKRNTNNICARYFILKKASWFQDFLYCWSAVFEPSHVTSTLWYFVLLIMHKRSHEISVLKKKG